MLDMFEGEGAKRAPGDLSLGWLSGMLSLNDLEFGGTPNPF